MPPIESQTSRREDRPSRGQGFTLIEVLVVVGIIGLLTAIAVIGFRVVGGAAKSRVTATALENCSGLLNEYKLIDPTAAGLIDPSVVSNITGSTTSGFRWIPSVNGQPNDIVNASVRSPSIVSGGTGPEPSNLIRQRNERYLRDETARVIKRLSSVPKNRAAIDSMSPDKLLKAKYPIDPTQMPSGDPPEYALAANQMIEGVVLADGNGYPVYFIPGGGLLYVNLGYNGTGDRADKANFASQSYVRAPDHGPFWASPGPDGDLTTGDDNQYSFGQ